MQNIFKTQMLLVGELEGRPIAFASGSYDEAARLGFVDVLAVAREHQGRGYGREMLRGMLAHFKTLGAEQAHLECLADNDPGNRLYESEGFVEVARSIRWYIRLA
jgi:ribosomal-protein-alanine N-acetyltransferase